MEEKVFYTSTDNIVLCGLLSEVVSNHKIVVLCHGLNGNKTERKSFDKLVNELGKTNYNSFRFDFRGHGESSGNDYEMTISKELEDLEMTLKYLQENGYDEFILLGASFGASIISLLKHDNYDIKGLICWYGALDYKDTIYNPFSEENKKEANAKGYYTIVSPTSKREYKLGKELFDEVDSLAPYKSLIDFSVPVLFVHGSGDTMISYTVSEKISLSCKNSKLVIIKDAEHCFSNAEEFLEEACDETINFIKYLNL